VLVGVKEIKRWWSGVTWFVAPESIRMSCGFSGEEEIEANEPPDGKTVTKQFDKTEDFLGFQLGFFGQGSSRAGNLALTRGQSGAQ
jgi:hypothetical protein